MADTTEPTNLEAVSHARSHLLEAMRLIDELERSMRPLTGPAPQEVGDE